MNTTLYRHSVLSEPLAVMQSHVEMLGEIHERARLMAESVDFYGMKFEVPGVEYHGGVAVIPVTGPFVGFSNPDPRIFGATSVGVVRKMFREAMESSATTICLAFNSPGGRSGGIFEIGSEIFMARGSSKRIIGLAEGQCCSAAYHIAAQCQELFTTESSMTGSIGVIGVLNSFDRMDKNMGIDSTIIASHELKATGNGALTPNQSAYMKDLMESVLAQFKFAVSRGRPGIDIEKVSTGRCWIGRDPRDGHDDAVSLGLCDGVMTLEDIIQKYA